MQEVLHLCHSIIFCGPECISVVAALVCGLQPKGEVVTWGTERQLERGMGVGGKRKEERGKREVRWKEKEEMEGGERGKKGVGAGGMRYLVPLMLTFIH